MATGDVTVSIAIEGGITKSVVLDSVTREKSKLYLNSNAAVASDINYSVDANWQIYAVNAFATTLVVQANNQLQSEIVATPRTFTPAG